MKKIERFDKYMNYKGLNDNKVTVQLGLSVGLLGKSRKEGRDLSDKVIEQILNFYTDINKVWLLTGEGEMLNTGVSQDVSGDGNTSVAGNGNNVNTTEVLVKALAEIEEHRKLLLKKDEQIDRLLTVIDKLTNK